MWPPERKPWTNPIELGGDTYLGLEYRARVGAADLAAWVGAAPDIVEHSASSTDPSTMILRGRRLLDSVGRQFLRVSLELCGDFQRAGSLGTFDPLWRNSTKEE